MEILYDVTSYSESTVTVSVYWPQYRGGYVH